MLARIRTLPLHWLLTLLPLGFLMIFFVVPNVLLLSVSFRRTRSQILTTEPTLENFGRFFNEPIYLDMLWRTLSIGIAVGLLVVIFAFPIAYFLTRTRSRWQGALVALAICPLLASVIVRTYGWFVILHRGGVVNTTLIYLGIIDTPLKLIPSVAAIIVGLTHVLLPYGILTIMSSLQGINPKLEQAAMNLGAGRFQTFIRVVLPLSLPGVIGGFLLAFAISISAYATPAVLGGPRTETMATQIFKFMVTILDWSMGATFGAVLIVASVGLLVLSGRFGAKRRLI